ncbi:type III secretion protein HrpB4 [Ralstonia mojiangensis]|uniref:type III secretion protein HrpB4 n=1 Tax=Ralstonia mojiangensis TaxID=2953895 RepID=UPI0020914B0E|nr:type III secretion protein HrpB4 [Ralstonia mojiangensis]MCO5414790.1 type III secretion protein HrpB4 [Ralstonia mojiangensis]
MNHTSAAPDPAAAMILRMLHAYQERLHGLAHVRDASVLAVQGADVPAAAAKDWRQVCIALGVGQVGLPTLLSHAHRLAVLEKDDLQRVLAARMLIGRRAALARCIDGAYLAGLAGLLGEAALAALTQREHWAPDAGGPLPALDLAQLAEAGLHALIADGTVSDPSLAQLMRLTIGMQAPVSPCAGTPIAETQAEAFMATLPVLFPELSWLFG